MGNNFFNYTKNIKERLADAKYPIIFKDSKGTPLFTAYDYNEASSFLTNNYEEGKYGLAYENLNNYTGINPNSEGAVVTADRNSAMQIANNHAKLFNLPQTNPSDYLAQAFPNGVPTITPKVNTDPIRDQIFKGNYNGKKFEPTESNIKHYLDLYESDKRLNKEYSAKEWVKGAAANVGIGATMAATPYVAPYLKSAGQWAVKNLVLPEIAAQTVDLTQRAVTGTTLSEQVHDYLRYNKGLGELPSSLVGGLVNPGYWVNPLMTGKYTGPLFQKLGWTPNTSQSMYDNMISGTVAPSISPTIDTKIKANIPKSNLQTHTIQPISEIAQKAKLSVMPYYRRYITKPLKTHKNDSPNYQEFEYIKARQKSLLEEFNASRPNLYDDTYYFKFPYSDKISISGNVRIGVTDIPYEISPQFNSNAMKEIPIGGFYADIKDQKYNLLSPDRRARYDRMFKPRNPFHYSATRIIPGVNSRQIDKLGKLVPALQKHVDEVQTLLGDDGIVGGSAIYGQISGKIPHDLELVTTPDRLNSVINKLGGRRFDSTPLVERITGSKYAINDQPIEVQTLQSGPSGNAKGLVAIQYFRQLYPKEYHTWLKELSETAAQDIAKGNDFSNANWIELNAELPIKTEDLYRQITNKSKQMSLGTTEINKRKIISDLFSSEKGKHIESSLDILLNPEHTALVHDTLKDMVRLEANGKLASELYPNMRLDNVEKNKEFLKALNIAPEYANNPDVMRNIIDRWYISNTLSSRAVFPKKNFNKLTPYEDALQYTLAFDNGEGSGIGGNRILHSAMPGVGGTWQGITQTHLTFYPEKITNPMDLIIQHQRLSNLGNLKDDQGNIIYDKLKDIAAPFANRGVLMDDVTKNTQQSYIRQSDVDAPFWIGNSYGSTRGETPSVYMGQFTADLPQVVHTQGDITKYVAGWGGPGFMNHDKSLRNDIPIEWKELKKIENFSKKEKEILKHAAHRKEQLKDLIEKYKKTKNIRDKSKAITIPIIGGASVLGAIGGISLYNNATLNRWLNKYLDKDDPVISKMSDTDKYYFTSKGFEDLKEQYKNQPYMEGASDKDIKIMAIYHLQSLYEDSLLENK